MQSSTKEKYKSFPISTPGITKPRILIFIGSLCQGGKERRLIELLTYFKGETNFEILVVLTRNDIHYQYFFNLGIPYKIITKTWKRNDPTVIYKLYRICKEFQPNLIHTWGRMQSFYILPTIIWKNIPLINSQITGAPVKLNKWSIINFIDRLNFHFSKVILSNSKAGIKSYNPPINKTKAIHNGINLNRFRNLPSVEKVKAKYGIATPYTVVMVAAYTGSKDYGLFYRVADKVVRLRDDISFICVGECREDESEYKRLLELNGQNSKILFPGVIKDVEALVNACTIGVLFSTNGEGISNSIMEYMALGKPVIANDAGGMKELVHHNSNGYLITKETDEELAALIIELIDNQEKCESFGITGKRIIEESFSLDRMGKEFEQVYKEVMVW